MWSSKDIREPKPFSDIWKDMKMLMANRGLTHSADPEEIDDLERYITAAVPPLGEDDNKAEGSL
jgi:hypothetical protein